MLLKMDELKHSVGKAKNPKVYKTFIVIPTPLNAIKGLIYFCSQMWGVEHF